MFSTPTLFLIVAASLARTAVSQATCSQSTYGQQCNNNVACACAGTECAVKPCFLPFGGGIESVGTAEDFALCNVNNATTFFASVSTSANKLVLRTPLRVQVGNLGGGQSLIDVSIRIKASGCSQAELATLSTAAKFSSAADGAVVVDVGSFASRSTADNADCNTWTRPNKVAAAAREAALDQQCPWRKQTDLDCSVGSTKVSSSTSDDATAFPTSSTSASTTSVAVDSSTSVASTSTSSSSKSSAAVIDDAGSASSTAVSSVAMCAAAAAATVAAMNNRAPWQLPAAVGVAGLFAAANAQSTCDVWVEVLAQSRGGFASARQSFNGTDVVLEFAVAVPGRPFVDGEGKHVVSGVERKNDTKAAPSAICSRKSGTGSQLNSALIEAATAELGQLSSADDEQTWLMQATAEHASVASFAQFSLNLMANAAPSPLLASALRAAQDEVLHADACLAMARAVSSKSAAFEAFPAAAIDGMRAQSLVDLALATLREGGIAELISTLDAVASVGEAARRGHNSVAGVWRAIATDESRHALLAWRTIAWSLRRDASLVDVLAREISETARATESNPRHSETIKRVVEPLFKCVQSSTFEDVGTVIDERVTSALNSLELAEFNVDTVMTSIRDAIVC
jgi:hypothetical protein